MGDNEIDADAIFKATNDTIKGSSYQILDGFKQKLENSGVTKYPSASMNNFIIKGRVSVHIILI